MPVVVAARAILALALGLLAAGVPAQPAGPAAAGRLLWRFVTGGRAASKPAASGRGTIYVASEDRHLYALGLDGSQRWRAGLGDKPAGSPVVASDGSLLLGTEAGRLVALRPNGRSLFRFDAGPGPCLTPALARDGSIYLPLRAGLLVCLDYRGQERWRYRTRGELSASPVVTREGEVLLGTADRRLVALDPLGHLLWELELPGPVGTAAIGPDGTVYVGAAGLHAVEPSGALRWSRPVAAVTAEPVLAPGERVLVGAASGRLYAFTLEGRRVWDLPLRAPLRRAPAVGEDGTAYVGTAGGALLAVSPAGRQEWRFDAKQAAGQPSLHPGGILLMGAEDWIVYALASGSRGPAATSWPELHHDGQNTGRAGAPADLEGPAAMALRELALSGSADLQRAALQDIAAHLSGQRYLAVSLATLEEVLGLLAGQGILRREGQRAEAPAVGSPVRGEACRLLGALGSDGAWGLLLQLFGAAEDPGVRIAALQGLEAIGLDPRGELARAILYGVSAGARSERLLLAAAAALHAAAAGQGAHPDDLRALAVLAAGDYPEAVTRRAAALLVELSRRWE